MNYIVPADEAEWPKRSACVSMNVEPLCDVVQKIHLKREVEATDCR